MEYKKINYRQWGVSEPKAILLLVHGLGTHGGRWEAMADFFVKKNISSYAIELGNPNQPDGLERRPNYINNYHTDILSLYKIVTANNPSKKIFLVGESMGALVSFSLASCNAGLFAGLICISPAFANKLKASASDYLKIAASIFYNSKKCIDIPIDSSICTRDIEFRKNMDSDPMEYKSAPPKLLLDILLAQMGVNELKNKMNTPVLFLTAGADMVADPKMARKIFDSLALKDKKIIEYPDMYHSLSIELGRETVFEDILKWVEDRI